MTDYIKKGNYKMNNELIKIIGDKEYHFKFKSKKCIDVEKATGKDFMELLQDTSLTNVARLLKVCCLNDNIDEYELLDELLIGSSLARVLVDIIWETAAISGIISREDKKHVEDIVNKATDEDTLFDNEENKKK